VCLALLESARTGREVRMQRQVPPHQLAPLPQGKN
jgi:hypothetical protein